jgi:hypothetical protein
MLNDLWEAVKTALHTNEFLSGGAVLMALGAILASLRRVPRMLLALGVRQPDSDGHARRFAALISDRPRETSMAELQGLLIRHAEDSGAALAEAERRLREGAAA